jgi:AraC-like DNA-binding protein
VTSDPRAAAARQAHRDAAEAGRQAAQQREVRDRLVRQLREEDPVRWSYPALARAVGCSPELIAHIVKADRRVPTPEH